MAKRTYCIVTSVTAGAAFAVREDTDESIYIPTSVNQKLELEEMDRLHCVVVENKEHPERTPWLMLRGRLVDDEGEQLEFDLEGD